MVEAYWTIGQMIVEEEQKGKNRAQYGEELIFELETKHTKTNQPIRIKKSIRKCVFMGLKHSLDLIQPYLQTETSQHTSQQTTQSQLVSAFKNNIVSDTTSEKEIMEMFNIRFDFGNNENFDATFITQFQSSKEQDNAKNRDETDKTDPIAKYGALPDNISDTDIAKMFNFKL